MANSTATKMPCSQFNCSYSPQLVLHGNGSPCCDSTQQIQDGLPGQSVCPCQLDRVLQHRIASMPVNVLQRPPFGDGAFTIGSGSGLSAFYSPLTRTCDFKDMAQPWRDSWYLSQATRNPFEFHGFDPHTHAACTRFAERFSPIDLAAAGARRKNATRETTSTLKAWLYEHRKNPYPTKGEKIMLAILTKMTLTQVSTWFANARRRLKKENKMTWSPRNRCGERKDVGDSSDIEDIDLDINSDDEKPSTDSHSDSKRQEEVNDIKKENVDKSEGSDQEKSHQDYPNAGSEKCDNSSFNVDETTVAPTPAIRTVPAIITKREHDVSGSMEDSPVKSLRKWVDGCFYSPTMSSCPVPQPSSPLQHQKRNSSPPSTPTQRTSTEIPVITSAPSSNLHKQEKKETSEEEKSPSNVVQEDALRHEEEPKAISNNALSSSKKRTNEPQNYREFDAALALTTLSSR